MKKEGEENSPKVFLESQRQDTKCFPPFFVCLARIILDKLSLHPEPLLVYIEENCVEVCHSHCSG